ncbi:hypothetical protein DRO54_11065 [Candidatus Bathyarchaeota archaeon]|nr:MAG: hypothetical protein DRO54_11065 [Candidatus Bathyarchaeota archaeon]
MQQQIKVAITGGSGFIGSSLAKSLSELFNIKVLDVREPNTIPPNAEFHYCDVRDVDTLRRCLSDVDAVIHTAVIQIPAINENKKVAYEVNVIGTHNVCMISNKLPNIKALILTGSWHIFGEQNLSGEIREDYGFRPYTVDARARLYVLSKIIQESIASYFNFSSEEKYFITVRLGTVLGKNMPEKTAASIFIREGLRGNPITPYKHTMYRPMLYVDVHDVCEIFKKLILKLIMEPDECKLLKDNPTLNITFPRPITIKELAEIVRNSIVKYTGGSIVPPIKIVDTGLPEQFSPGDKDLIKVDISKLHILLGVSSLTSPEKSIERIVRELAPVLLQSK